MTEDLLDGVQSIFRDILDDSDLTISHETTATDVPGWDSLAHLSIVDAIENEYKVRFALGELQGLRNVGDMIQLIVSKRS